MNIWICKSCKGTNVSQNAHINPNHLNKYGGTLIHDEDIAWEDCETETNLILKEQD
jgi:hypothetical protein